MNEKLESMVAELYKARLDATVAKNLRAKKRTEAGWCERTDGEDRIDACWLHKDAEPCEACAIALPYSEAFYAASRRAANALRAVLREGKRIHERQGC